MAASEVAAGKTVDIALFFSALAAWVDEEWDLMNPEPPIVKDRLVELGLPPLSSMLETGRSEQTLRVYACSASVRILGLDNATVQARVDAILGWQSFSRMIERAGQVVTL